MKLATVTQRGSRKDFVDVFALGQRFRLEEMLIFYREKYGLEDCGHVLAALSYFDDADRERMPTMLERRSWPSVKSAVRGWVRNAARG
jgi:hypothetical protein